jgi:hypothetical protein
VPKKELACYTQKVLRTCHDHVPLLVKKAFPRREIKMTDFYLQLLTLSDYFFPFLSLWGKVREICFEHFPKLHRNSTFRGREIDVPDYLNGIHEI